MTYANKLYRSRNGILLGICQGIADWKALPVSVVRLIFVVICFASALVPCLIAYLVAGLIIPIEPSGRGGKRGYNDSRDSDIHADFEDLKDRVNKMEDEVTGNKESDWDKRFHGGK